MGEDSGSGVFVFADDVESAGTLTVESHDLGEGLSNDHFESLAHEVSETLTVLVEVTGDEALVGSVEEWIELVLLAYIGDLLPLLKRWVDACWIVCTRVKKDAGAWGRVLQVLDHAVEVKTLGLLVEVTVLADVHTNRSEDLIVITPSWITNVNGRLSVLMQKFSDDSEGTGATQSLAGSDTST